MGGRPPKYSTTEYLMPFVETEGPVLGTSEYAEYFDFSRDGGAEALRRMQEQGFVNSKLLGNARAWWLTEDGKDYLEQHAD